LEVRRLLVTGKGVTGMSRSYKHTPRWGERKHKFAKKQANRVVRRNKLKEEYPQHGGYRKRSDYWDICDYETVGETFEQYYQAEVSLWLKWQKHFADRHYPDRREVKKEYDKAFIRK